MNSAIIIAVVGAIAALSGSAITYFSDRRRKEKEPRLIESQASQAEAEAAAILITGAKDLVDLLTKQLELHRVEIADLRVRMSDVAEQEKRCVERLESVNRKLDDLKNVVTVLADQVRGLGGEPNLPDLI